MYETYWHEILIHFEAGTAHAIDSDTIDSNETIHTRSKTSPVSNYNRQDSCLHAILISVNMSIFVDLFVKNNILKTQTKS